MSLIYSFTPEGRKGEQQVIDYIKEKRHLVSSLAMGLTIFLGQKIGEKDSKFDVRIIG